MSAPEDYWATRLHDAVDEHPGAVAFDVTSYVTAGRRRVRRNTAATLTATLAAVSVAVAVATGTSHHTEAPHPAGVVSVDLHGARPLDIQPTRLGGRDRFLGLTSDGLVLRKRHTDGPEGYELGLMDPANGRTDWLPGGATSPLGLLSPSDGSGMPPWLLPVQLTAARLVLLDVELAPSPARSSSGTLLVFDRESRTWQSGDVTVPAGLEAHAPPSVGVGLDGRLYLGQTYENVGGPVHWFSYPIPQGGEGRPEPALTGTSIAFGDDVQARADSDGRVVLSSPHEERLLAEHRPRSCGPPSDANTASWPGWARMAGDRPVITYWCERPSPRSEPVTVVYDTNGGDTIEVADAAVVATDQNHVLLVPSSGGAARGMYLLNLDTLAMGKEDTSVGPSFLANVDSPRLNFPVGLSDGLLLWDNAVAYLP